MAIRDDIPILIYHLQHHPLKKVAYFWDYEAQDQHFRTWKENEWWKAQVPRDNVEVFYLKLCAKKIPKTASPDKLRWGYTNQGNFNIKEAIELFTKTYRLEKEVKWRKIWGGSWWPKVATFSWLLLK